MSLNIIKQMLFVNPFPLLISLFCSNFSVVALFRFLKVKTSSPCRTDHFSVLLSNVCGWCCCAASLRISAASQKLCRSLRMFGKRGHVSELRHPASLSIFLYMVCCCLGSLFRSGSESVSRISFSFTGRCTYIPTINYSRIRICIAIFSGKFFL